MKPNNKYFLNISWILSIVRLVNLILFNLVGFYSFKTNEKVIIVKKLHKIHWQAVNFAITKSFSNVTSLELEILVKKFIEDNVYKQLVSNGLIFSNDIISIEEQSNYKKFSETKKYLKKKFEIIKNTKKIIDRFQNNKIIKIIQKEIIKDSKRVISDVILVKKNKIKRVKNSKANNEQNHVITENLDSDITIVKSKPKKKSKKVKKTNKIKNNNKTEIMTETKHDDKTNIIVSENNEYISDLNNNDNEDNIIDKK